MTAQLKQGRQAVYLFFMSMVERLTDSKYRVKLKRTSKCRDPISVVFCISVTYITAPILLKFLPSFSFPTSLSVLPEHLKSSVMPGLVKPRPEWRPLSRRPSPERSSCSPSSPTTLKLQGPCPILSLLLFVSLYLSIYLSVCLSVCLSIYIFIYLFLKFFITLTHSLSISFSHSKYISFSLRHKLNLFLLCFVSIFSFFLSLFLSFFLHS
jgi:hypothetical protein